MFRKKVISIFFILLISIFTVSCDDASKIVNKLKGDDNALPKVTVGIQVSPAMSLVMVAKDQEFFKKEGVDVEIKEFTAGKFALQAFLSGAIDFAVSGEVPVTLATLQGNQIRVVAQVVEKTVNEVRVVALRDGELNDPTAYFRTKKRKLATSFGGGPEFFTYNFMKRYKITDEEIEIISQKPEDMPASLAVESVDAIAIFDPFAFIAENRLKNKVITFADETLYSEFYVLDARPEQIVEKPEVIKAMISALDKAGKFIEENPDISKDIVQKYTKLDREVIDGIWGNFIFKPALTQTLLDYWNEQADWAKDTGKVTEETTKPNFKNVLEPKFLMEVAPNAIKYQVD